MNYMAANSEKVLAVFTTNKKTGFFSRTGYTVIITDQRIIFALLTSAMLKAAAQQAAQQAKAEGKGFWSQMGASAFSGFSFHTRYFTMTPENILLENKENYYLPHTDISFIIFKRSQTIRYRDDSIKTQPGELIVETPQQKHKFGLTTGGNEQDILNVLHNIYGTRLKVK